MPEKIIADGIRDKAKALGKFIGTIAGKSKVHLEVHTGRYVVNAVERLVEIEDPEQSDKERFKELVGKGYVPIFYTVHQTLVDGHVVAFITDKFRAERLFATAESEIPGVVLPIAASLFNGAQGKNVTRLINATETALLARGLTEVPLTRDLDVERYGMKKDPRELELMFALAKQGYAFAVFPEGRMEGGRYKVIPEEDEANLKGKDRLLRKIKKLGKRFFSSSTDVDDINGMQMADENSLTGIARIAGSGGRKVFFVPVGINGTYRIFNPRNYFPVREAWLTFAHVFVPKLAQVKIGTPVTEEDLASIIGPNWKREPELTTLNLMSKLVPLVPKKAAGVYANSAELINTIDQLSSRWSNFAANLDSMSEDEVSRYLKTQGFNKVSDLLANISVWWDEIRILMPEAANGNSVFDQLYDAYQFEEKVMGVAQNKTEEQVKRVFNRSLLSLRRSLSALPSTALTNPRVKQWINSALFNHFEDHKIAEDLQNVA